MIVKNVYFLLVFGMKVALVNTPNICTASTLAPPPRDATGSSTIVHMWWHISWENRHIFLLLKKPLKSQINSSCYNLQYKEYTWPPPRREATGSKTVVKSLLLTSVASLSSLRAAGSLKFKFHSKSDKQEW